MKVTNNKSIEDLLNAQTTSGYWKDEGVILGYLQST